MNVPGWVKKLTDRSRNKQSVDKHHHGDADMTPVDQDIDQMAERYHANVSHIPSGHVYFWAPVLPVVLISVIIVGVYGWDRQVGIIVLLLMTAGALTGVLLQWAHKKVIEQIIYLQQSFEEMNAEFYSDVFSVWSRQIQVFREIGDESVSELSGIFAEIVDRLSKMVNSASDNSRITENNEHGFMNSIEIAKTDIKDVFEELKSVLEVSRSSKQKTMEDIAQFYTTMKDMAEEAKKVSMQSIIISLNAEIEAARAGEAGRAFAAVVGEMRELASQSSESAKRMADNVKTMEEAMEMFRIEEAELKQEEDTRISGAEELFNNILRHFSDIADKFACEMEQSVMLLEIESKEVHSDITSALMALQFQDRVSQIAAHVISNMEELKQYLESGKCDLNSDLWLQSFREKYSVDEEFHQHDEVEVSNKKDEDGAVTFF